MNDFLNPTVLIALIAAVIVVCIALIALSQQNKRQRRDRERISGQLRRENEAQERIQQDMLRQMAELSGNLDARMQALTAANDQKLEEMRRMVGEKLENRLRNPSASSMGSLPTYIRA